jgi:transposase
MLDALVAGTTDPAVLADLSPAPRCKKLPALQQALTGRFRAHHAFLVSQLLAHLDYLDEAVDTVSAQIDTAIAPFHEELARLDTIHGVNTRTAEVLIATLGADMTVFPTAKHAASWAGLCPGNHESAGKHRFGRTRHGHRWLRTALIEAALAASVRSTKGAFAARYRRIVPHRGHKKAVVAVAHAMLVTAYHLLARPTTYQDPGSDYDDRRQAERVRRRAFQTLERQGFRAGDIARVAEHVGHCDLVEDRRERADNAERPTDAPGKQRLIRRLHRPDGSGTIRIELGEQLGDREMHRHPDGWLGGLRAAVGNGLSA